MIPEDPNPMSGGDFREFVRQTPGWLAGGRCDEDVVLSSRVRLARNIAGFRFAPRASVEERHELIRQIRAGMTSAELVGQSESQDSAVWFDIDALDQFQRDVFAERQLISHQHAKGRKTKDGDPRAVVVFPRGQSISIMVNEEDHLRMQAVLPGFALGEAMQEIGRIDDRIERELDYAFSPRFGYLTACPTNVGTGIRVSVMLHLPALRILGEIDKVKRAAADMSLAVRGFWGEGSEAEGDLYQLSNQTTLGKSEDLILSELERSIVPRVIGFERHARDILLNKRRLVGEDLVYRALGTLTHARRLSTGEAMSRLSELRLGISLGILEGHRLESINRLLLEIHPAHLQQAAGRSLGRSERASARATLLRERLG